MFARLSVSTLFFFIALGAMPLSAQGGEPVGWRYDGTGHYPRAQPPRAWSTEQNVRWSSKLPSWGNGSPVVYGDRVFVTAEPTWLIALDRESGAEVWRAENGVVDATKGEERQRFVQALDQTARDQASLKKKQRALSRLKRSARKAKDRAAAEQLLAARVEARAAKDWARADAIRDELSAGGWTVEDLPEGARLKREL